MHCVCDSLSLLLLVLLLVVVLTSGVLVLTSLLLFWQPSFYFPFSMLPSHVSSQPAALQLHYFEWQQHLSGRVEQHY